MGDIKPFDVGKAVFKQVNEDDVPGLSAELAYRFLLALFPFFIFLTAVGGLIARVANVQNPAESVVQMLGANLPPQTAGLITEQLQSVIQASNPGLLSFGVIAALWAASAGMKSVMKAMNRAYDVPESRPFLKKNLVALGLTLLFGLFIFVAFALLVIGQVVAQQIATTLGLPPIAVDIFRWALAVVFIAIATAFVYWQAPNMDLELRWITPGSILFTLGWLIATALFAFYVANFGNYNATYGALGGVVVLLLWFYLTGFILLLGAELNAVVDEQAEPDKVEQRRQEKETEAGAPAVTEDGRHPEGRVRYRAGRGNRHRAA